MLYLLEKGSLYITKVGMQFLDKNAINPVTSFQSGIKNKCEGANANFGHLKFNEVWVVHKSQQLRTRRSWVNLRFGCCKMLGLQVEI